jgi:hypothetical protein
MARKSALRRCAKAAPTSADIDELLAREDADGETPMVDITPPEPEPPRAHAVGRLPAPAPEQTFLVVDCDGEQREFDTADKAARVLAEVFADAERRGRSHVDAALENNAKLIAEIGEPPHSPPGTDTGNPATEPATTKRKDDVGGTGRPAPDSDQSPPGGEHEIKDMLGGKPRKPAGHYKVKREGNTTDDWYSWEAAIQAMIDNPRRTRMMRSCGTMRAISKAMRILSRCGTISCCRHYSRRPTRRAKGDGVGDAWAQEADECLTYQPRHSPRPTFFRLSPAG